MPCTRCFGDRPSVTLRRGSSRVTSRELPVAEVLTAATRRDASSLTPAGWGKAMRLSSFRTTVGLFCVLALLAASAHAQERKSLIKEIQQRGELRVGYATADPHSFKDSTSGQWKGIAVEIMEEWAQELGVKHVAVDTSWDAMIAGLQAGKYDVAAALNRRPARALAVTFSIPYMNVAGTFAVHRDKIKARAWEELDRKGVKVAVMMGTAEDKALSRVARNMEIVRLPDQNEARIAVQSGRVTSFFDDVSGNAKFAQANKQFRLIIPSPLINLEGTAFAIRKGYVYDDLQALDIMVENYVNTGKLRAVQAKYGLPNPDDFTK
jgi:polar amino acid transport system substrate-binding protein